MIFEEHWSTFTLVFILALELAVIVRVILRPHRDPASRIAWIVVIGVFPLGGMFIYLLFGEVNIGRRRAARKRHVLANMPALPAPAPEVAANAKANIPERYRHLFRIGQSISGFEPIGGNIGRLMPDSNATIDALVTDIDGAEDHVHLLFYIWLTDNNGCKVVAALKRAAARGVTCRAMVDGLGSRTMLGSRYWAEMRDAGVHCATALRIGNPLLRPLRGRIDLRNHRKIVVIDNRITYCGSQNCADPEFRVKAAYAPWVDAMMRFEGPIARQNQQLFASDWLTYAKEKGSDYLGVPIEADRPGFSAQVIGTGPTVRDSAMPEMFESLMFAARRELIITTPYYVPDESMQSALCTAARSGVDVVIVFPARNDSRVVSAASHSYYAELLTAGVKVYEYVGGLLHTKSLTLDGDVTLIGSANLDRRSFDLNYENNILFFDPALTGEMRQRQYEYIAQSNVITGEMVASWGIRRRLLNNTVAMLGPVL